jgi:nucleotide-binding universal stress UspA family protein
MSDNSKSKIVVGVDGSPASEQALHYALRQAELIGASVEAVSAWTWPPYFGAAGGWVLPDDALSPDAVALQTVKDTIAKVAGTESAVEISALVVEGTPARVLLDAAADADLLVVGSRGHGEFAGALLGSVSLAVASHAKCPVVIIHDKHER